MLPALLVLLMLAGAGCDSESIPSDEIPVDVSRVALDSQHSPVVILEEHGGHRRLPIWIGTAEARSIALQMEQYVAPRPNTHDLAKRVIQGLEGEIVRVVVTELIDGTYYAVMFLRANGAVIEIDSRPSDAIAIALRTDTPIFVRQALFDSAAAEVEAEDEAEGRPI